MFSLLLGVVDGDIVFWCVCFERSEVSICDIVFCDIVGEVVFKVDGSVENVIF